MIILLSPAKKLLSEGQNTKFSATAPRHLEEASYLVDKLKKKSPKQLEKMMHISSDLAGLNHERFQTWTDGLAKKNTTQAALMFKGDVYVGLGAEKWKKSDFNYAQKHVRILSGLYGLLRPLDAVKPYRLEMGSRFEVTKAKKNLYKYWGETIKNDIESDLTEIKSETVVNLASNEYSKAALLKTTEARVITPSFKELRGNGEYKALMLYVKQARGMMADFAVKHKVKNPDDLKAFDMAGYTYNKKMSEGDEWVFTRDQHQS